MRYVCLLLCLAFALNAHSQTRCLRNSHLYQFDRNAHPRHFTERLGSHPQFPFLQEVNGVNTAALFIRAVRDSAIRLKYKREFDAFNLLLHNSGFRNGYMDLTESRVKNVFIPLGTTGNLGFYDPQRDLISYNYVTLEPAGESPSGVAAWKLTTRNGCYLYILHKCGNAFYPNEGGAGRETGDCCRTLSVTAGVDTVQWKETPTGRMIHVRVNLYQGIVVPHGKTFDTVVQLVRHVDTTTSFPYGLIRHWKVYGIELSDKLMLCRDSSLRLFTRLLVDSSGPAPVAAGEESFVINDTTYNHHYVAAAGAGPDCHTKWEISIDGGLSFNSIPRFNSATAHSQTNGSQPVGELTISRICNSWLQAGVMADYMPLSYQDDVPYPGSVAGTYNTIWLGRPMIPVQLFGKATIGGPLGWQSTVALAAGYALPEKAHIENSGATLTTDPQVKGAITAGIRLSILYLFNCHFGIGVTTGGQYFLNKNALITGKLWAMPVMGGVRIRF